MTLKQIEFQLFEILLKLQAIVSREPTLAPYVEQVNVGVERLKTLCYNLAVVGQFKRGKSSLINAILGLPVLPADVTPTTATVNRITFGIDPKVTIHYKDSTEKILDGISELSNYVTKLSEEKSRVAASVREAVIAYPAVICQNHVDIIDTPGLGDDEDMTRTTISILKHIDAAVVVISALSPYDEAETKFVISLLESKEITNIVFVVNFMDQIDDDEYDDVFKSIKNRVIKNTLNAANDRFADRADLLEKTHRIIDDPQIFPVSAKKALKAFATNDTKALNDSRIPQFKESIFSIITREQCVNSVRKSIDLLLDVTQKIDDIQAKSGDQFDREIETAHKKFAAEDDFIKNVQYTADSALFMALSDHPDFSPRIVCDKIIPVFIRQMSTITLSASSDEIRKKVSLAAKDAEYEITKILSELKDNYKTHILNAFAACKSSFPIIDSLDSEQILAKKLDQINLPLFNLSLDQLLPPGELLDVDVISNIRCGLFSFLSSLKAAIDQYRMKQRVALFETFGAAVRSLKTTSRNDAITAIETKKQNILQWCSQIKDEISPLLGDAQKLLKDIS